MGWGWMVDEVGRAGVMGRGFAVGDAWERVRDGEFGGFRIGDGKW